MRPVNTMTHVYDIRVIDVTRVEKYIPYLTIVNTYKD